MCSLKKILTQFAESSPVNARDPAEPLYSSTITEKTGYFNEL